MFFGRLVLALLLLFALPAGATTIVNQTRSITDYSVLPSAGLPAFASLDIDYKAAWNAQSSTISTVSVANADAIAEPAASMSHLSLSFSVVGTGLWTFMAAPNAAYGGALYLDGMLLETKTFDLHANGSWADTDSLLAVSALLTAGTHTFETYWAEDCCAVPAMARLGQGSNGWLSLAPPTVSNDTADVPEPATLSLLGVALATLAMARRGHR